MKKYYVCDPDSGRLEQVLQTNAEPAVPGRFVTKAPSKAQLDEFKTGVAELRYDAKDKNWESIPKVVASPIVDRIDTLKVAIDAEAKIRLTASFQYRSMEFSLSMWKMLSYMEIVTDLDLGVAQFPISIQAYDGQKLVCKDQKDLSAFWAALRGYKEKVLSACRMLKYGSRNGHLPLSELSEEQLSEFDVATKFEELFNA